MDLESVGAIPCDGLQNGIGGFGPEERLWVVIIGLDKGGDGGLEIRDAAMDAALANPSTR
jgi:hypothetical protein